MRRFSTADLAGMAALRNARTRRDGHGEATSEAAMAEYYGHLQRCDPDADLVVAERAGRVVGYARTTWSDVAEGGRDHWLIVEADPDIEGLEERLLEWCERRALDVASAMAGRARLVAEAVDGSERQRRLVDRSFAPLRHGAMMIRPHLADVPDRPLPAGVEVRPVTDSDLRPIWHADVEAFRDHWGYVEQTEEDWALFAEQAATSDLALWQIAWAADEVVGQVRTYVNEGERELFGVRRAWTESISTHRAWRGRGLASALICRSLRQLEALGYEQAALGVDTENLTGALALYQSLGYGAVATEVTYARAI